MARHSSIRPAYLGVLAACMFALPALAADSDGKPGAQARDRRLRLAGGDDLLWMVVGEWDETEEAFLRRFLAREIGSDRVQPITLLHQRQRVAHVATADRTLHLFLRDGSHIRVNQSRQWMGHTLPNNAVPLTVAGEATSGPSRLWAVVSTDVAATVEEASRKRRSIEQQAQTRSEVADEAKGDQPAISSNLLADPGQGTSRQLVVYDGVSWQPGIDAPPEYADCEQVWLAVVQNRFHLFWVRPQDDQTVHYARYENNVWTPGAPIPAGGPIESAAVRVANTQLVFAALLRKPDLVNLACSQWSRPAADDLTEPWSPADPLLDGKDAELTLPVGSAVGLFGDRLALLRFEGAEAKLGLWAAGLGGKPDQSFQALPTVTSREGTGSPRGIKDLLGTLIVAAVLLLLFWRRQEAIAAPIELPAHLQVAGPGRRAVAFLIDAAPALAIMVWIWHGPLTAYYTEARAAFHAQEALREAPAEVLWAWFWFRVIYVGYVTVCELAMSTTPGKRLLGCGVLSESVDPAGPVQILIRNISRLVELEPFLQIWPFMLIVFFTRNRQRLGDLLARTIVVERGMGPMDDEDSVDREDRSDPS